VDGTPFGRYRLVELLGRGGMGEVWRAHDIETKRTVAIKMLPSHLADDRDFVRRFRREAEIAAQLNSPHVIPIHNYGEIDRRLYVDMRLVEGRDLATVLTEGPLPPIRAVRIIEQVAKALHAAHEAGLLHRDVKPSNVLLNRDDFAYLIDFGIARVLDDTRITTTGNTIGTYHYIAPERLTIGAEEDARADVYSLACVLFECLTGGPPFPGSTMPQVVGAHLYAPPPQPSISQPDVPTAFDAVIATGMAKDPNQRYANTIELADAARDAVVVTATRQLAPQPIPPSTDVLTEVGQQPRSEPTAHGGPPSVISPSASTQLASAPTPTRQRRPWWRGRVAVAATVVAALAIAAVLIVTLIPTPQRELASRSYGAQIVLPFTGLSGPSGVAVDSTGTLYITDLNNRRVLKLAPGSSTLNRPAFDGDSGYWISTGVWSFRSVA
jgi:serine/threonine protein kinase, bacterial